ncbi:Glucan endo-1,3-alpha-glucosidase agn1 [Diaporthe eres]|uniref:Glucan endo-1,3-alpha-glucosidase agn1 n=1 Tax=Diaporthe eres TaxID=83184 RepID=A0ABR1PCB3_DIAER
MVTLKYDILVIPRKLGVARDRILGMLFGVGQIAKAERGAKGLRGVAQYRKGMATDEISSLGRYFADGDSKVQTLLGKVCKL